MNKLILVLHYLYSLLFCLRFLPFRQAIHIPILIHYSVKVKALPRGAIMFSEKLRHGMLVLGFEGSIGRSNCKSLISISKGGRFIIGSNVQMAKGIRMVIEEGGMMTIGSHFWCNGDCFFYCTKRITIGDNNMYGWDIHFNTSDGHHVYADGLQKPTEGDIKVGNHVWIASYCRIAKNSTIADDCIVAQCSLVNREFERVGCLIGGMPAKMLKSDINWNA